MPTSSGGTFGTIFRAFHIAAKVIAAISTLSGLISAKCAGTCMNGTL